MLWDTIKEIENLRMTEIGSRPVRCEKLICIGGMVIARLPNKRWWSSWKDFNKYAYTIGSFGGRVEKLLTGLAKLGIIKQEAVDQHIARVREVDEKSDTESEIQSLQRMVKKRGKQWVLKALKDTPSKANSK